jgi:hypothetical protein
VMSTPPLFFFFPLRFGGKLLRFFGRTVWLWLRRSKERCRWRTFPKSFHEACFFDKDHFLLKAANGSADRLDRHAMKWLFTVNDLNDTDMDKFLEGLPGYIRSDFAAQKELRKVLTTRYLHRRIKEHLLTCVTAIDLSDQTRINRVSTCIDAVWEIIKRATCDDGPNPAEVESPRAYMQHIVKDLNKVCGEPEEKRDLRAFCIRALAFQGFLTKCLEPTLEPAREESPGVKVPDHFIPLYEFSLWSSGKSLCRPRQFPTRGPLMKMKGRRLFLMMAGSSI